jgi:hypothetical protein
MTTSEVGEQFWEFTASNSARLDSFCATGEQCGVE